MSGFKSFPSGQENTPDARKSYGSIATIRLAPMKVKLFPNFPRSGFPIASSDLRFEIERPGIATRAGSVQGTGNLQVAWREIRGRHQKSSAVRRELPVHQQKGFTAKDRCKDGQWIQRKAVARQFLFVLKTQQADFIQAHKTRCETAIWRRRHFAAREVRLGLPQFFARAGFKVPKLQMAAGGVEQNSLGVLIKYGRARFESGNSKKGILGARAAAHGRRTHPGRAVVVHPD